MPFGIFTAGVVRLQQLQAQQQEENQRNAQLWRNAMRIPEPPRDPAAIVAHAADGHVQPPTIRFHVDVRGGNPFDPAHMAPPERKSFELLYSNLNAQQRKTFDQSRSFSVWCRDEWFLILPHCAHSVKSRNFSFCVYALDVPLWDQMLTFKLLLEKNPEAFFEKAVPHRTFHGLDPAPW